MRRPLTALVLVFGCVEPFEDSHIEQAVVTSDWYVSPTGSPANAGTQESPWSLAYTGDCRTGAQHSKIRPGDRVNLLGGTYPATLLHCSGAAGNPIIYQAAPGARVVLDGSIPDFTQANNTAWELYSTGPNRHVYRSVATYDVRGNNHFTGFIEIAGTWISLIVHGHNTATGGDALAYLNSDVETYRRPDHDGIAAIQNLPATGGNVAFTGIHGGTLPDPSFVGGTWTNAATVTVSGTDPSGAAISESSATAVTSFRSTKLFKTVTQVVLAAASDPTKSITNLTFGTTGIPRYIGPGLAYNVADKRIYVRLDNPSAESQRNRGVLAVTEPDPRLHSLRISPLVSIGLDIVGSHITVDGLAIEHFGQGINTVAEAPVSNIILRNLEVTPGYFGVRLGYATNVRIEQSRFHARMPATLFTASSVDIKGGDAPADNTRKVALDLNAATHIELYNNEIEEFYDGILASNVSHHISVRHNTFRQIWDDAWQMYYGNHHADVGYNRFFGAGVSRDGSGSQASIAPDQGTVWIHHNIFSPHERPIWWYRGGHALPSNVGLDGYVDGIPLSAHGSPADSGGVMSYSFPWKLYYNTFVVHEPKDATVSIGAIGLLGNLYASGYDGAPHEVYNNIFVDPSGITPVPTMFRTRYPGAHPGRELYDGNVFSGWGGTKTLYRFVRLADGTTFQNVTSPENLRANAEIVNDTRRYSIPSFRAKAYGGWEQSGFSFGPITFDECYQPIECFERWGPCSTGAVSLVGSNWPGTDEYEPHRGAVPFLGTCWVEQ